MEHFCYIKDVFIHHTLDLAVKKRCRNRLECELSPQVKSRLINIALEACRIPWPVISHDTFCRGTGLTIPVIIVDLNMVKPRLIILIRHAQSEGNKNREIHQKTPDHRVPLTAEGWDQAHEAGRKLRSLLRPTDKVHLFVSPYLRTRQTAEGLLAELTSNETTPTPFPRETIKIYEEPRLREQDFGNFQPDAKEMSRMWQERADYGHLCVNAQSTSPFPTTLTHSQFLPNPQRRIRRRRLRPCLRLQRLPLASLRRTRFRICLHPRHTRPYGPRLLDEMVPLLSRVFRRPPQHQPLRVRRYEEE